MTLFPSTEVKSLSCVRLFATPWTVAYRLFRPWDFPGKSTGVGCHYLVEDSVSVKQLKDIVLYVA